MDTEDIATCPVCNGVFSTDEIKDHLRDSGCGKTAEQTLLSHYQLKRCAECASVYGLKVKKHKCKKAKPAAAALPDAVTAAPFVPAAAQETVAVQSTTTVSAEGALPYSAFLQQLLLHVRGYSIDMLF